MSNEMKLPTAYNVTDETIAAAKKALNELGFPDQEPIKKTIELMVATAGLLAEHAGTSAIAAGVAEMVRDIANEMLRLEKKAREEFLERPDLKTQLNQPGISETLH